MGDVCKEIEKLIGRFPQSKDAGLSNFKKIGQLCLSFALIH